MSYSGCLAITFRLAQKGTTPEQFFKRFFFTHGHDKSIWAVANHLADAAGVDSQIYELTEQSNPQLARQVRVLEKMPEAPTGPIVVRSNLDSEEKASLRRIFYTMHENADLLRSMKTIVIDRFVVPDTVAYEQFKRQYAGQRRLAGN